jgi:hypothetical protein
LMWSIWTELKRQGATQGFLPQNLHGTHTSSVTQLREVQFRGGMVISDAKLAQN